MCISDWEKAWDYVIFSLFGLLPMRRRHISCFLLVGRFPSLFPSVPKLSGRCWGVSSNIMVSLSWNSRLSTWGKCWRFLPELRKLPSRVCFSYGPRVSHSLWFSLCRMPSFSMTATMVLVLSRGAEDSITLLPNVCTCADVCCTSFPNFIHHGFEESFGQF